MWMACKYDWDQFVADCSNSTLVHVHASAMETAGPDFNLFTQQAVLEFVHGGGLERLRYITHSPWQNNRDPSVVIWVDEYDFYSGSLRGYLAFLRHKTGKWGIKSFKKSKLAAAGGYPTLADKLKALTLPPRGEK